MLGNVNHCNRLAKTCCQPLYISLFQLFDLSKKRWKLIDDNLFVIGKNKEDIKSLLLLDFEIVNNWFYENFMILNPEKSHYMCLGKNLDDNEVLNFNNLIIESSKEVEILGIKIDKNLNFNNHIINL